MGYVDQPVQDASGRAVTVTGAASLGVRTGPASGVDIGTAGARPTYTGPERLRPAGTTVVRELARAGDFEATLTWVVGTSGRVPSRVAPDHGTGPAAGALRSRIINPAPHTSPVRAGCPIQ